MHPVVIRVGQLDRPVQADDPPERQSVGRIEHRAGKADVFHEIDPALAADSRKGARREKMRIGRVQMIVGRIGAAARANRSRYCSGMRAAIAE